MKQKSCSVCIAGMYFDGTLTDCFLSRLRVKPRQIVHNLDVPKAVPRQQEPAVLYAVDSSGSFRGDDPDRKAEPDRELRVRALTRFLTSVSFRSVPASCISLRHTVLPFELSINIPTKYVVADQAQTRCF